MTAALASEGWIVVSDEELPEEVGDVVAVETLENPSLVKLAIS
jgi:hypothetical protein